MAVVLNPNWSGTAGESTFAELEGTGHVLYAGQRCIPPKMLHTIHRILAVLHNHASPSAILIANSLRLSKVELEVTCNQMVAVILFQCQQKPLELNPAIDTSQSSLQTNPHLLTGVSRATHLSPGGSISFYHKSDFLLDPHRPGAHSVNKIIPLFVKQQEVLRRQRQDVLCWQVSSASTPFQNSYSLMFIPVELV